MNARTIAGSHLSLTEVGLGCWQLGGGWAGPFDERIARQTLCAAYDTGTRFFDTADVYSGGRSEKALGLFRKERPDILIATKLGRGRIYPDAYTRESVLAATRASRERLGVERIDLTQLHCVPLEVLQQGEIFDWLREQREQGLIGAFGASVESMEEGLVCLEQEGLASLQIIFNLFRHKPLEELLPRAAEKGVGIIVRLPLASGLLAGKFTKDTTFSPTDHRTANRDGRYFNVGETFAGLPFEKGVEIADQIKALVPAGMTMAGMSLRWILDHEAVTAVIPGASSPDQARANAQASDLPPLPRELHDTLAALYREKIQLHIRGPY